MFDGVVVIAGPARSGKTELLLTAYRQAVTTGPAGGALWLAPTRRAATDIRGRLLDASLTACLRPNCCTFEQLAQSVLDAAQVRMRPITPLMKRHLVRELLAAAHAAGRLEYFGPIVETAGLVDLVEQFITELKRLEVWPVDFDAACRRRGASAKDRELGEIYSQYQLLLNDRQLYDRQGCFWLARTLLKEGQLRPFENVAAVFVDGFTDFTRTEHEILEVFAERAKSLVITLPLEPAPLRDDLFAKTTGTLKELRRRFPNVQQIDLPRRQPPLHAALAHIEAQLFGNPRQAKPGPKTDQVEILAAAKQSGEIEAIGQRIKRLLVEGDVGSGNGKPTRVRPGDILVLLRAVSDSADLLRETFGELGIPLACEASEPLNRSGAVTALLGFVRLAIDDWPFRRLLSLLGSNYFHPSWPEAADRSAIPSAEVLIRQLQIPEGRGALLRQLERWATKPLPAEENAESEQQDRKALRARRAALAYPLLARLQQSLAALPTKAAPGDWADALQRLAEDLGVLRAAQDFDNVLADRAAAAAKSDTAKQAGADGSEQDACRRLFESLRSLDRLSEWRGGPREFWNLRQLYDQLVDIAGTESRARLSDETGRVRVLSAITARNISAPYVFLAGLSEKAFPPPDREDRLYGDAEYQRLIEAGLPLVSRAERQQDEMLLFYEVSQRATRRLYLSYPALDEKAQTLSPSPYLIELERACGEGCISRVNLAQLSPVPQTRQPLCPRDGRVLAVAQSLAGDASLLGAVCGDARRQPFGENLLAALQVTHERHSGEAFGRFEGLFVDEAAQSRLAARFGPDRAWSPSQFEEYALCPYEFFLHRVLRLEPLAEMSLETDYLSRGRLLHGALAKLHRRLNEEQGQPASPAEQVEEEFNRAAEEVLLAMLETFGADKPLDKALREIDRRLLAEWVANYREQHRKYDDHGRACDSAPRPAYFEVSFGPQNSRVDAEEPDYDTGGDTSLSTPTPYELRCGDDTIRITGRIDRIDVGEVSGRPVFNIIDYKSGSSAKHNRQAIDRGLALQLPLYAMAVEDLLLAEKQAVPWKAAYWYVKDSGAKELVAFHEHVGGQLQASDDWSVLKPRLVARVLSLVQGIRQGQFPMHSSDDECTSTCPYRTVCRVNQVRSIGKTWTAPGASSP